MAGKPVPLTREMLEDRVMKLPDLPGCWLWLGPAGAGHTGNPYPMYGRTYVHRLSHELFKGPIPDGLEVDHKCRTPLCVNPQHLEAVTHVVNVRRGRPAWQTHCKRGHPFGESNTYRYRPEWRQCRTCKRQRDAVWRNDPARREAHKVYARAWYQSKKNAEQA